MRESSKFEGRRPKSDALLCRSIPLFLALVVCFHPVAAQQAGTRYAVVVGGLGGSAEYTERFRGYLFETHRALVSAFGFEAANVAVFGENALEGQPFVTGVSTAENLRIHFARLAARVTPDDHVYVFLFGHGSYDGRHAQLNLPRRDLDDTDYADLVGALDAGRVVFVNTAPASGPFVEALSAPERVVVTATRSGTERNETVFPRFLVEAFTSPAADLDRNGDLSVREVFVYASQQAARSFEETGHLATEHALLEDTGDLKGFRAEELDGAAEGNLAGLTYLRRSAVAASGVSGEALRAHLREKEEIERAVAALKSRKADLSEDAYYAQLETLFVRLARLMEKVE